MLEMHQRVEDVVAAFARGELVVVTDDDDRENEGDLFIAASLCTPEKMAFIIRHTSGIVCAPLDADEELRTLHISFDALAIARERGWMVWDDVVTAWQAPCAQGDGDPGA